MPALSLKSITSKLMVKLVGKSILELHSLLQKKQVKAVEILESHLQQLELVEKDVNAFNTLTLDRAYRQVQAIDRRIEANKELPALAGIPVAIKDNICVSGYPTTCSSKILENFSPAYEATVAIKLEEAGAIFVGKTNMDEFAMGSSTENSAFKITHNPWALEMVPGGSSGGSAAAVASGAVVASLGSDTGGSIRQPAALCGIVGMKPTYGLVSRFGLVAFASSLDQIGPFGRTVEDVAFMLSVIKGHDQRDSTSLPQSDSDFTTELGGSLKGLKIGLIKELLGPGIDHEVKEAVLAASKIYQELGAEIHEMEMSTLPYALPVYYLIANAEASANLARYDGVRYGYRSSALDLASMYEQTRSVGFGAEVKRRIMLGTYALSSGYYEAYYKKAQQVRRLIKQDFDKVFESCDLLLCPTSPSVAFPIGSKTEDPLQMYLSDIATIPANLAGIPGISLPCGFGSSGLPIGMQLLGPALSDRLLLNAAFAFQQSTNFHQQPVPLMARIPAAKNDI